MLSVLTLNLQEALRGPGFDQLAELLAGLHYHLDSVCSSRFWRTPERERGRRPANEFGNAIASRGPMPLPAMLGPYDHV